jgi:hypothetical protein
VNRFAVEQNYDYLIAALALLSEAPIAVIAELLFADNVHELVIACRAARVRWATAASILRFRGAGVPISAQRLDEQREFFESLTLSEAQF